MTSSTSPEPTEWVVLADATEEARSSEMKRRYGELAQLSDEERLARLTDMAQAEYQLPEDKLHIITRTRLLVWLEMEHDQALAIAHSYDQALLNLSAPLAMRRVGAVQTVARDFTPEQMDQLYGIIPSVVKEVPRTVLPNLAIDESARRRNKKSWWKFW